MKSVKSLSEFVSRRGGSALRARLKHIDDRLVWFGFLRLTHHAAKFGISDAQGKIDLRTYRNLSKTPPPERKPGPKSIRHDGAQPGFYERPDPFTPLFVGERSLDDLNETKLPDMRPEAPASFNELPLPKRNVRPDLVRPILAATELRGSCAITYQSMTSADSTERVICPHSLIKASGRWHVRAFDFARRRFVDFSLSRVLGSSALPTHPAVPIELDDDWHAIVPVEFSPHPDLSPQQRIAIAREYSMSDMTLKIPVRRALLFYLLDEMRLFNAVRAADKMEGRGVGLWLVDFQYVTDELAKMNFDE